MELEGTMGTTCISDNTLNILMMIRINNRPFYRYGGIVELIRFKEYYRMPGGAWAHFVCVFRRFSGHFFFKFS